MRRDNHARKPPSEKLHVALLDGDVADRRDRRPVQNRFPLCASGFQADGRCQRRHGRSPRMSHKSIACLAKADVRQRPEAEEYRQNMSGKSFHLTVT